MVDEVLYFRADWCGPCRQAAKVFDALKEEHPEVSFCKVDIDQESDLSGKYSIRVLPTMLLIRDGAEIARVTGARTTKEARELLGLQ